MIKVKGRATVDLLKINKWVELKTNKKHKGD